MTIRTRFAPSPTGYLHVGGLRSALYNYLFARQHGGTFILRIEDTDQARKVEGAVENLLATFAWAGLDFDEGPYLGGPHGPYVQSERLEIYRKHVHLLAESGQAYPCFCTPEELEKMRSSQADHGQVPMYDRRCRKIDPQKARERIETGESHVWRMAIPDHETILINDLIRGDVRIESGTIDDQVLMKSDGFPTYHLANVVDDHLMRISHVIRGEEWLPSTPKHVLLYRFFGWEIPQFAHLPLLLNPDRSKMSKRVGDVAVEDYRRKGILPQALLNFVALLGWHPQDEREIFSIHELIREFDFDRVNKAGAVFDMMKLQWMNSEYIKSESDEELFENLRTLLSGLISGYGEERVRYAAVVLRGGVHSYQDLADRIGALFAPVESADPEMLSLLKDHQVQQMVCDFSRRMSDLPEEDWNDFARIESVFKLSANAAGQTCGLKGKHLWLPLRAALTGHPHGPELGKMIGIWGRDRVLAQLHSVTSGFGNSS